MCDILSGMLFLACCFGVREGRASQNEEIRLKSLYDSEVPIYKVSGAGREGLLSLCTAEAHCTMVVYSQKSGLDQGTFDSPFAQLCQIPKKGTYNSTYE